MQTRTHLFFLVSVLAATLAALGCKDTTTPATNTGTDATAVGEVSGDVPAVTDTAVGADVPPAATGSLQVTVLSTMGEPIANADVSAGTVTARTDKGGVAVLEKLPLGSVVVTARKDGAVPVHQRFDVVAEERLEGDLSLPPVASVQIAPTPSPGPANVGGLELTPAGFVGADGKAFTGTVELRVVPIDDGNAQAAPPAELAELGGLAMARFAISAFAAGTENALQPEGPLVVRQKLTLTPEMEAAIAKGDTSLTFRRFDAATGTWVEAGSVSYAGGVLTTTLTHLSWFAVASATLGKPVGTGCLTISLTKAGAPFGTGVWVKATYPPPLQPLTQYLIGKVKPWGTACATFPALQATTMTVLFGTQQHPIAAPPLVIAGTPAPSCANPSTCANLGTVELGAPAKHACVATPQICNDQNACTTDTCDATTGCKHVVATGTCDDGNACTQGDTCTTSAPTAANPTGAVCKPGQPKPCADDGIACTVEGCDTLTGGCVTQNNCPTPPCVNATVTIADGFAKEPKLESVAAGPSVSVNDTFDGAALDATRWLSLAENGGATIGLEGGAFVVRDVLPKGTGSASAQYDLAAGQLGLGELNGSDDRATFKGSLDATVTFGFGVAADILTCQLSAQVYSPTTAKGLHALVETQALSGATFSLNEAGGTPKGVKLGTSNTLALTYDPTGGKIVVTLTGEGGSTTTLEATEPKVADYVFTLSGACESTDATTKAVMLRIDEIKTNLSFARPAHWRLTGSALNVDGTAYTATQGGPGNPGFAFVTADGAAREFGPGGGAVAFAGTEPTVLGAAVTMTLQGQTYSRTAFTPKSEAELKAFVEASGATVTKMTTFTAFTQQPSGAYLFAIPAKCP